MIEKWSQIYRKGCQKRSNFLASVSWTSPHGLLATWFGFGLLVPAPGTWGTLGGLLFGLLLTTFLPVWSLVIWATALFFAGLWAAHKIEQNSKEHDSSFIVIDEVAAILLVMGAGPSSLTVAYTVAGFLAFRFFDVIKPWPVSWADTHISGALGVMLDDILAALYAIGSIYFIGWALP